MSQFKALVGFSDLGSTPSVSTRAQGNILRAAWVFGATAADWLLRFGGDVTVSTGFFNGRGETFGRLADRNVPETIKAKNNVLAMRSKPVAGVAGGVFAMAA